MQILDLIKPLTNDEHFSQFVIQIDSFDELFSSQVVHDEAANLILCYFNVSSFFHLPTSLFISKVETITRIFSGGIASPSLCAISSYIYSRTFICPLYSLSSSSAPPSFFQGTAATETWICIIATDCLSRTTVLRTCSNAVLL